ncbi:MAG: protein arginine kinase [Andreesenia angusta]|nr:protein arginine kinase [Andreesenia angusta]
MKERAAVLSSRIRLARNLKDTRMPLKMNEEDCKYIRDKVKTIILNNRTDLEFQSLSDISELDREVLAEQRCISKDLIRKYEISSFLTNEKKDLTIMINEEDQIRIQALSEGIDIWEAWTKANEIDDLLDQNLDYAYDSHFGYLTTCPTNTGTGLRASIMVHLPFLTMDNYIEKIASSIGRIGVAIRGLYGEGSESMGAIYQISNQMTTGESEEDIIRKIRAIVTQLIYRESVSRRKMIRNRKTEIEDKIFRAYGILKNSRILDLKESMNELSYLRIGVILELIDLDEKVLNDLAVLTQPANIKKRIGKPSSESDLNIKRAEVFRNILSEQEV